MRQSKRRRMASLDAMDVATRFVNAANQHDPDGLVACVHRDFQSIQPVHPARSFRGVGQLRSNWEAIFRAEPGFRLTVLRAHATDDTVWMELHGAGDDEEAAGTFILGVEEGRIHWIRVYSDVVRRAPEPPPDPTERVLAAVPDAATEAGAEEEATDWDAVVTDSDPSPSPPPPLPEVEERPDEDDTDTDTDAGAGTEIPSADDEMPTVDGDDGAAAPAPKKGFFRRRKAKS